MLRWVSPDDGGVECPVCDKRVKQGFVDCEQQKKRLESKNQRLTMTLTIGLTLAGREAATAVYEMLETVEKVAVVESEPEPKTVALSHTVGQDNSLLRFKPTQSTFAFVPPLLPSIRGIPAVGSATVLPDPDPMILYGLAWYAATPSRRRIQ